MVRSIRKQSGEFIYLPKCNVQYSQWIHNATSRTDMRMYRNYICLQSGLTYKVETQNQYRLNIVRESPGSPWILTFNKNILRVHKHAIKWWFYLLDIGCFFDALGVAFSTRAQYDVSVRQHVLFRFRNLPSIFLELVVGDVGSLRVVLDAFVHGADVFVERTAVLADQPVQQDCVRRCGVVDLVRRQHDTLASHRQSARNWKHASLQGLAVHANGGKLPHPLHSLQTICSTTSSFTIWWTNIVA